MTINPRTWTPELIAEFATAAFATTDGESCLVRPHLSLGGFLPYYLVEISTNDGLTWHTFDIRWLPGGREHVQAFLEVQAHNQRIATLLYRCSIEEIKQTHNEHIQDSWN